MIGDIPIESTVTGICDVQYDTQAADLFCTKALTQEPKLCIVCPFLHCYVYVCVCMWCRTAKWRRARLYRSKNVSGATNTGVGKLRPADVFGLTRLKKCEVHMLSFLKIQPRLI